MTVAFRTNPGITRRSMLIVAGLAITALIGLTRVYLRVHWLSDVTLGVGARLLGVRGGGGHCAGRDAFPRQSPP